MPSGKKKTHQEFVDEMKRVNPNIEITGIYMNDRTKIQCRCMICNNEWEAIPNKLLQKRGCPKCAGNKKYSHKQFIEKMELINPNIKILGNYINNNTKIHCKCIIDDFEWNAYPYHLLRKHGCPVCARNKLKTHQEFIEEMREINPNIIILDKYTGAHKKIKCKCSYDGYEWYITPRHLLRGECCPVCKVTKGEKSCLHYFQKNNITYIPQYEYCDLLGVGGYPLRFDFAIINQNNKVLGLVEYDGEFHFSQVYKGDNYETTKIHDNRKNIYCQENNIPLLRIPYWEYDNIDEILDEFIQNISQPDCEGKNISC